MNIINIINYIYFAVILLVGFNSQAQDRPNINYTQNSGLLSNKIYGIAQNNKGFIWFTTKVGLTRFDGKEFIHYSVLDGLSANFNWRLFHDSQDRIWLFNNVTPFTYIKNDSIYNIGSKIDDFYLQSIVEDNEGNIHFNQHKLTNNRYIITKNNKLVKADKSWFIGHWDNSSIYLQNHELIIKNSQKKIIYRSDTIKIRAFHFVLLEDYIYFIYPKEFSVFNLITKEYKVLKIENSSNQFITINKLNDKIIVGKKKGYYIGKKEHFELKDSTLFISHVLVDNNKNEWLTTLGRGVYFYPNLQNKVVNYSDNLIRDIYYNPFEKTIYYFNSSSNFYMIKNKLKNYYSLNQTLMLLQTLFL